MCSARRLNLCSDRDLDAYFMEHSADLNVPSLSVVPCPLSPVACPLSLEATRSYFRVAYVFAEPVAGVRDREAAVRVGGDLQPIRRRMTDGVASASAGRRRCSRRRAGWSGSRGWRCRRRRYRRRRCCRGRWCRRWCRSGCRRRGWCRGRRRRRITSASAARTTAARRRGQGAGNRRRVLDVGHEQPRSVFFDAGVWTTSASARGSRDPVTRGSSSSDRPPRPCGCRSASGRRAGAGRARTAAYRRQSRHDCWRTANQWSRADCWGTSARALSCATGRRSRPRGTDRG